MKVLLIVIESGNTRISQFFKTVQQNDQPKKLEAVSTSTYVTEEQRSNADTKDLHQEKIHSIDAEKMSKLSEIQLSPPLIDDDIKEQSCSKQTSSKSLDVPTNFLPSFSQIDKSVLQSLPLDIQKEVLSEYKQSKSVFKKPSPRKTKPEKKRKRKYDQIPTPKAANKSVKKQKQGMQVSLEHFQQMQSIAEGNCSQISYDVLQELPMNIQLEVLNNIHKPYQLRKQREREINQKQPSPQEEMKQDDKSSNLMFELDSIDDIKDAIDNFVLTNRDPENEDVIIELMLQLIVQLYEEKNLEDLHRLLIFLRRRCDEEDWKYLFNILHQKAQQLVKENYGGQLPIPSL